MAMVKKHTLIKSTFIVGTLTLFSRLLGFARDMLMAFLFGASLGLDVFLVAFKLPNLMRALFAEGSFAQALVPILTGFRHQESPLRVKEFISRTLGLLLVVLLFVTILAEIFMPILVIGFAPGFLHDAVRYALAIQMLRITFPYFFFIILTAFFSALLNSYHKFALSSFIPIILNMALIFAALFLTHFFQHAEMALAWAVLLAGICQLSLLFPSLIKNKLFYCPRFVWSDKDVKRLMKNLLPSLFGVSIVQLGLFINMLFASFLPKGSISWLYYADRLTFFPLGIFGVTLSTVILPHLSQYYSNNIPEKFNATLDWALRCLMLISLPAVLGLVLFATPIVELLFRHGEFSNYDALMTTQSVIAFAIGIPGFMAVKILTSAFYARHEVRLPVKIASFALLINIIVNFSLMHSLHHIALALGTSLATTCNAVLLCVLLVRLKIYRPRAGWKKLFMQLTFANTMMAILLCYAVRSSFIGYDSHWQLQSMRLFIWISIAILGYFCMLRLSGMRLQDFKIESLNTA